MNKTPAAQAVANEDGAGKSSRSYRAPALEKGLDVLEMMAGVSQPMALTTIAEKLGRTKQELFRVVASLCERGYLIRGASQRYRMSTKLFELGARHASTQAIVARATPHMETLAQSLHESCHLSIVVQNRMLVVARADSDADVAIAVRVGASFTLHQRNSGLVALAYFPDEQRQNYWQQSGESKNRVRQCEQKLAAIRQQGYDLSDSPLAVGVKDCATPILGAGVQLLAVLCVSHMLRVDEQATRRDIAKEVVRCANAISHEFGPVSQEEPAGNCEKIGQASSAPS